MGANSASPGTGSPPSEAEINKTTADNLASAVNIRTGAEYVLGSFLLRGGVGLQQAPIVGDDSFYSTFSLGLGVRQKRFFFDFAYRRSGVKSTYTPYQVTNGSQQFVDNNVTKESFVLTAGFRW